jgi:5-hydroxyisourate hydrolase
VSPITTHVLDLARGRPAAGVAVRLERAAGAAIDAWTEIASTTTDSDGRAPDLSRVAVSAGVHRLTFETGAYFRGQGVTAFHPRVVVSFEIVEPGQHHHVPLLVAPFGYSTYRGS